MCRSASVDLILVRQDDFDNTLRYVLLKKWHALRDALVHFDYFKWWSDETARQCCILSKLKDFKASEVSSREVVLAREDLDATETWRFSLPLRQQQRIQYLRGGKKIFWFVYNWFSVTWDRMEIQLQEQIDSGDSCRLFLMISGGFYSNRTLRRVYLRSRQQKRRFWIMNCSPVVIQSHIARFIFLWKKYPLILQVILGDGTGMVNYVHFILSGECRLIEHMLVREYSTYEGTRYELYDPDTSDALQPRHSRKVSNEIADDCRNFIVNLVEHDFREKKKRLLSSVAKRHVLVAATRPVAGRWRPIEYCYHHPRRRGEYPGYILHIFF